MSEEKSVGQQSNATCEECGRIFTLSVGGGFTFHLLRCDKCGKTKSIPFDDLGELHLRYLKSVEGPYSVASRDRDEDTRKHSPVKPISGAAYYKGVEKVAGSCKCRGKFTFDAPPRCPKCHSTNVTGGETTANYD